MMIHDDMQRLIEHQAREIEILQHDRRQVRDELSLVRARLSLLERVLTTEELTAEQAARLVV